MYKFIYLTIACIIIASFKSIAQQEEEKTYYNDFSVEYGLFASLNSKEFENLVGNKLNIKYSHFFYNDFGYRTGISYINNFEGSDQFYSVPIQLVYRTPIDKSFWIGGSVESIEELIFKIILGLVPRQTDFHGGMTVGYIKPDNSIGYLVLNDGSLVQEGFQVNRRFFSTFDLGMRLNYKIKRVGVIIAPNINYVLSKNFKYYSGMGNNDGYTPQWFLSITLGLNYRF